MGAYSRWTLIQGWALIRINTVVWEMQLIFTITEFLQTLMHQSRYFFFSQKNLDSVLNILLLMSAMLLLSLRTIPRVFVVISHTNSLLVLNMASYCSTKAQLHSQIFREIFFLVAKQQRLMNQLTQLRKKKKLRQQEQTQEMFPGECLTKEQCS